MEILMTILPFVPAVIIAIALIALLAFGYVKAPPDVAYIISGLHKKPRILVGKAGIKIPFLERLDKLALGAIQAKAEAEAEGLMKKAEAMKQYGEAAKMDMQMEALKLYFQQLPAIAQATGQAYTNVDKIVMFGDDTSKLSGNIIKNVAQVSEGLSESLGIDVKTLLTGFLGGKLADSSNKE